MAITEVKELDGSKSWTVYVNLRSPKLKHIRVQKRIKHIDSKSEALRIEKNLIKELSHAVAIHEGHGYTWSMVVDYWHSVVTNPNYIQKTYSPATIKDYVAAMRTWTRDWLDRPASELGRGEGRQVLDRVIAAGRTKGFQKRLKNTINMIYNFGIEERIIKGVQISPVHGIQITIKEDKKPEIFTIEQIRKLLYEANKSQSKWFPLWTVALLTGMRCGELYALKWCDVDFNSMLITVQSSYCRRTRVFKSTKAGHWRTVPLSPELKIFLNGIRDLSGNEFVLSRMADWNRWEQAKHLKAFCRWIDLPQIKFHTLRACFATQLLGAGTEPTKVMKVCGWKDLKTMERYIRLAGIDEKGVTDKLQFLPAVYEIQASILRDDS